MLLLPGSTNKEVDSTSTTTSNNNSSAFETTEVIQQRIALDTHNIDSIINISAVVAVNDHDEKSFRCDALLWQYEHLRQFVIELNALVLGMSRDNCTDESCPIMKATDEWIFLCAAHGTPQECCAMDYMNHTLDGVASLLTSKTAFPSRVTIPTSASQYYSSIARRLYRIFSHCYFHHEAVFHEFEKNTSLCKRFVSFVTKYKLIPSNLLIIPKTK